MKNAIFLTAALVAFSSNSRAADKSGFVDLFDGKSKTGWVQKGGVAQYDIEEGVIVGRAVPGTPNSFLCTAKEYGDFILEVEFKADKGINSGIQIRSHCFDADTTIEIKGKPKKIPAGRVHGYQVEIDTSDRAWSGGIYDEGRRGWLNDLKENPKAGAAFRQDDWNKYRVECRGDSIKTWINGVPAADLKDGLTPKGFIALQVHGIGKKDELVGKEIRWRNVRLKELR